MVAMGMSAILQLIQRGASPKLDPIGYINNESSRIIKNVCPGCYKGYSVQGMGDVCNVFYVWELDGTLLAQGLYENNIEFIIPNSGTYELCVTAYIRNPKIQLLSVISKALNALPLK